MVMLSQFSILPINIVSIVIQIVFETITAWLSAQLVTGGARLQDALIFALITYLATFSLVFVQSYIPALPFINIIILVQAIIKTLIAMQFFKTDFRRGFSIAGVQMLIGTIIRLTF